MLDAVGVEYVAADDIVAVVGVAANDDAEYLFHFAAVAVEGGAAQGAALAELGAQPAFIQLGQRYALAALDGIDQPDVLFEEYGGFHLSWYSIVSSAARGRGSSSVVKGLGECL